MKIRHNDNMCLVADINDPWIWHKRFCHVNFKNIHKLAKNNIVRGLPTMNFKVNNLCDACQKGKLKKSTFKAKNEISTKQPLELLHLDLFGPMQVRSINHNKYVLVIVDDFSRYTWTFFLKHKNNTFEHF